MENIEPPKFPKRPWNVYSRFCNRPDIRVKVKNISNENEKAKSMCRLFNEWKDNPENKEEYYNLLKQYNADMKAWKINYEIYKIPEPPERPANVYFKFCSRPDIKDKVKDIYDVRERVICLSKLFNDWKNNNENIDEYNRLLKEYNDDMKAWMENYKKYVQDNPGWIWKKRAPYYPFAFN